MYLHTAADVAGVLPLDEFRKRIECKFKTRAEKPQFADSAPELNIIDDMHGIISVEPSLAMYFRYTPASLPHRHSRTILEASAALQIAIKLRSLICCLT
jgi:hypothetical protein